MPTDRARVALACLSLGVLACNLTAYRRTPMPDAPALPVVETGARAPTAAPASPDPSQAKGATPSPGALPGGDAAKPPGFGNVLFADSFDTRSNRWEQFDDGDAAARYEGGRFFVTARSPAAAWSVPDVELMAGDAEFDVEATLLGGADAARFGLLFRYQGAFDAYLFSVSGDGAYAFHRLQGGAWRALIAPTASPAVTAGEGASNRLRVLAVGERFTFYVNDLEVAQATDAAFEAGSVGLAVLDRAEVAFDNVRVVAQ